jgi:hypothetical protein
MPDQYPGQISSLIRGAGAAWWHNVAATASEPGREVKSSSRSARRFHYLMLGLITLLQIGGIIDARTHVFYGFDIQSFFIPAHYALYGGWLAVLATVVAYSALQIRRGARASDWLPPRYALAALGAFLFGIAGALDAVSHTLLGFELNLEVLLSPAHLVLFTAFGLIYYSVLSHALYQFQRSPREHQNSLTTSLPLLTGIASLFHIVFWPAWYFDPMAADYASQGAIVSVRNAYSFIDYGSATAEIAGVGGIILTTLILIPFVVLPLYRWRLPSGSLTFIFAWVFVQRAIIVGVYSYLPAVLGAALVGELIWAWIRRGGEARLAWPWGYRLLAFSVPLILFLIYFLIVGLMPHGVIWPVHLWAGSILLAAAAGVLLSFAMIAGRSGVVGPVDT